MAAQLVARLLSCRCPDAGRSVGTQRNAKLWQPPDGVSSRAVVRRGGAKIRGLYAEFERSPEFKSNQMNRCITGGGYGPS